MAFVSMFEARTSRMRGSGMKRGYDLMAYSTYKYKTGKEYATILFSQKLLIKAGLAIGDYVDVLIEPTTGETIVKKVMQGGWRLYAPTKKNIHGTARLQFPMLDYGFPTIKSLTEIKNIHLSNKGILFNINELVKDR